MKIYYNLTQASGNRVVYFRSTDIEQHNYSRLLWSIPDEWLYFLSQGEDILVIDRSSNRGKIEHIFIPVVNDILKSLYLDEFPAHPNLKQHFEMALLALSLDVFLRTKFTFWRGKIKHVNIIAKTIHVKKERNPIT